MLENFIASVINYILLHKASVKTLYLFTGDSMNYNNNRQFTTKDRDNDDHSLLNCAVVERSGWWHTDCTTANLNGHYYGSKQENNDTTIYWYDWIFWYGWRRNYHSMKRVEMKIKLN